MMIMILSVLSVLLSLTNCSHLLPRQAYIGRMAQVLDAFLKINDQSEREAKKPTGDLIFNNNEIMNLSDSAENFSRVLQSRFEDWREKLLFCKPRPLDLVDVFGSPIRMIENNQLALRRTSMAVFSESIRPESFDLLFNNDMWHWWLYKGVRDQENGNETKAISSLVSHNAGDNAVIALVNEEAHIWRRGMGAFLVIGSRKDGPLNIVYPIKKIHGHEFPKSTLRVAYQVIPVQPGDIVIYCSGISIRKFSIEEMVEICLKHSDNTDFLAQKFAALFSERIPSIYHGYRMHVYQIKNHFN